MSPLLLFAIGALLLLSLVMWILLSPLRSRSVAAGTSREQLNAAIYRDELAELERDLAIGALLQADYDRARDELQRRLLEDTSAAPASETIAAAPASRLPWALLLVLPLAAALMYFWLGNPAALSPQLPSQAAQPPMSAMDIEKMVARLAEKMEAEPDNLEGWAMLARSYKVMGRFAEAEKAYARAGSLIETDADMLVAYADTLAVNRGGFDARVIELIDKALLLEPDHPLGLWMRGTVAYEAKDYPKALADWQALLDILPAGSQDANVVSGNIAEVKDLMASGQATAATETAPMSANPANPSAMSGQ